MLTIGNDLTRLALLVIYQTHRVLLQLTVLVKLNSVHSSGQAKVFFVYFLISVLTEVVIKRLLKKDEKLISNTYVVADRLAYRKTPAS